MKKSCWQCKYCWEYRPVGKEPLSDWSSCTHPDYTDEHFDRGESMAEDCPGYEEKILALRSLSD